MRTCSSTGHFDSFLLRIALLLGALISTIPGVAQPPAAPQAGFATVTGKVTVTTGESAANSLAGITVSELFPTAQQSQQQPAQPQVSSSEAARQSDSEQTAGQGDEGKKSTRVFRVLLNNLTVKGAKQVTPISADENSS